MACEAHIWCADRCHPQGTVGYPLELLLLLLALRESLWKHNCFCEQKELVLEAVLQMGPYVDGVFWYTKHVHYTLVWICLWN
jgi:hypothetical protein